MKKSNSYNGIITIKVQDPEGYKPRVSTYKVGYFSDVDSKQFRRATMDDMIKKSKCALEKNHPGVDFKVSATIEVTPINCFELKFEVLNTSDKTDKI